MSLPPVVALEVGTSKVVVLVGEMRDDGNIMITGLGQQPSVGVRKGEIVDFENAQSCIRSAIPEAEEQAQVTIGQIHLVAAGAHIQSVINRGSVPTRHPSEGITDEDIRQVMDVARAINLPHDRQILHSINQLFYIDEQEPSQNPLGLEGARLSLEMLLIHVLRPRWNTTVRAVNGIGLDVCDSAFGGLCAAQAVLTPSQKEEGVAVVDLGGGTTDYFVYAGNVVAAAGTLGIGGDHITNDISLALSIPFRQAETLKKESGSALLDPNGDAAVVSLPPEAGFQGKSLTKTTLNTVIHARVKELFSVLREEFEAKGLLQHLGAGIILTGGGVHLRGVISLAEQVFSLPISLGKPQGISGQGSIVDAPEYAAPIGMIRYGFKYLSREPRRSVSDSLRRLFGLRHQG